MCGIFGWFGNDEEEKLQWMADSLRHRGPDGDGYFYQEEVAFGMTRLAIIDKRHGQQPMVSQDKSVIVVCNGEIYNFRELKAELSQLGYCFETASDTEVLPAAYQMWGMGFLERLNGMFAIALYDKERQQLLVVRDRYGQKPLYYAEHHGVFYFASEIRALHAIGVPKELNEGLIAQYLTLRYVAEPDTLFQGIKILPAGHLWTSAGKGVSAWWKVASGKPNTGEINQLREITQSAVRTALVSDEPVAVHLSAGIDSSVLLSEIVRSKTEVTAITASFGADSDEANEAAKFAKQLGVEHHVAELSYRDLRELPRIVEQMELPVGDVLISAFDRLAIATQEVGAKVAIGGEGVDEVFAGYSFHKAMLSAEKLGGIGRKTVAKALRMLPMGIVNRLAAFPADLGSSGVEKIVHYLNYYESFNEVEKGIKLRTLFEDVGYVEERSLCGDGSLLERHLTFQFSSWLQDWAIIRQERNTMAHSIEYRMPFLDHRLVEFGMSAPAQCKIAGKEDKALWRKMAKRFYPEVQSSRGKQPFYFPVEQEAYFKEITLLWEAYLSNQKALIFQYFPKQKWEQIRNRAELTREFLPMKQSLALVILEIWLQQHFS